MTTPEKIIIGLVAVLGASTGYNIYQNHKLQDAQADTKATMTALFAKPVITHDVAGHEVATINTAQFATAKQMQAVISQLNTIPGNNIISKVDNNTQALLLLDKKIEALAHGGFVGVIKHDTVNGVSYPEYTYKDSTQWFKYSDTAGYNKHALRFSFVDSTELKTQEKYHFFKANTVTVSAVSKNPYANTTGMKSLVLKKSNAPVWDWLLKGAIFVGGVYLGSKVL